MFIINEDKSIYITRGDAALFAVTAVQDGQPYTFQPNDVVRFKVFEKKGCDTVVLQKDFFVNAACESVDIELLRADTKIGEIIHKPKDFWYEVELNPETYPQTIIGYDEDGAKSFRLLPEGKDLEPDEDEEQQGTAVYDRVLEIVGEMRGHSLQAAEDARQAAESAALADEYARELKADFDAGKYNGLTPYVGENGNWWIGGKDTGMSAGMQAVGNIVETFRTDLGDDWLLCNGAGIPEGEFPVLRELIPYNTGWVEYTSDNEYEYISPISNTHKWVRVKRKTGTGTDDYAWDKAEVFDAETREVLTVDCPLVVDGKTSRLYGITYDDVRYVLAACCIGEKTAGKLTLHYYKSDDLTSWEEFYVTTIDENYNASDFAFDGEEYLSICGYVTTDTSSNYTRNVYATPSNLGATTKMPDGGGGYKEPRFHAVFPGYFYVPSGNYTYLYRAGTGERVAWLSERPHNLVYFNDRYLVTAFDSISLSSSSNEIVDLQAGSHIDFKISTLLGYGSTTTVYGYGAEYEPNVNEWVFYYRYSSNSYYEVRISADADPTDPAQYRVKKIKSAPSSTAFIKQMSYNRANCDGYKFRDPSVKYLPESESNAYKYVYGGKEHVGKPVELEYIESTGMQYIDTGIKPNQNTKAVVDVQFTEFPAAHSAVFGANDTTNAWWAYYRYSDYLYRASAGGTTQKSIDCTDPTVRTKITLQKGAFTVDEQTVTIPETDYNIDLNAYLFALNKADAVDYPSSIKMYSCKIYDNDVLVRDYVPCRLASGIVCMYDRVSGEYALNNGAGKFIAGAEIGVLEEGTT